MPEIIGFSNRVAYEPDGIRLIPVRQYGADRLEPIKPVYLKEGYTRGTTSKINPVEAEAIVDQIEKCIADPLYDGLTFGVISLLGGAQTKEIEKKLLERLPPEEWTARKLHCGDAIAFQGAERDVMFLSMVAAPEPGRSLVALTRDLYVQR
ncbi:MAG: AAA domain-containing protein [Pseudonocardiaceae bacterium]